jgi:A/G-specific adenine glycosylase
MPAPKTSVKSKAVVTDRNRIVFFRKTLRRWASKNFAHFSWRDSRNHFHGLVAEVMLQRTRADQVVPVFDAFVRKYRTPMAAMQDKAYSFAKLLAPLGLRWRARSLRSLASILSKQKGNVPVTLKELRNLPGVGDYAAAAFSTFHLNLPTTIIDSNIVRLYGRFFGFKTGPETRRNKGFRILASRVQPIPNGRLFAYGLLDFTRAVCTPRPHCVICPLRNKCSYNLKMQAGHAQSGRK